MAGKNEDGRAGDHEEGVLDNGLELPDGSFFEELRHRPDCELVYGPLDGETWRLPDGNQELRMRNGDTGQVNVYVRRAGTNKFDHARREPTEAEGRVTLA
jgi:hypothetical protein